MRQLRSHTQPILLTLIFGCLTLFPEAAAQLSPGKLSAPHEFLDGTTNCLQCHESRKGVSPSLCLDCHTAIGQRIAANQGLHAQPDYQQCQSCHIDHHGRDFKLVWWGEEGEDAFDHQLSGYPLEGAHSRLSCRECHQQENIPDPLPLKKLNKNLNVTFLGLEQACTSCHGDEHRGQFDLSSCTDCHDLDQWKPASHFDHDNSKFPLTGSHQQVECASCHESRLDQADEVFVEYVGLSFQACVDCHQDPHQSRLGTTCTDCHSTEAWDRLKPASFDHNQTRFPLHGLHRQASCASCHGTDRSLDLAGFEQCGSCHGDIHLGQFKDRPGGADCAQCHDTSGFLPARYGFEEHRRSGYPLEGAHLAVACRSCHREVPAKEIRTPAPPRPHLSVQAFRAPTRTRQFLFPQTECIDCHRDPHLGEGSNIQPVDLSPEEACVSCHGKESWRQIDFDHDATEFPLVGAHTGLPCTECHIPRDDGNGGIELRFSEASSTCRECHDDPHRGQFDQPPKQASCTQCHGQDDWVTTSFDHNRDSSFPLDGAHQDVACDSCHRSEISEAGDFVRYRPLNSDCSSCHGSGGSF